jgi:histidyl-tRNA synthetase
MQSVKGMNDILPAQTPVWQFLESTVRRVLESYGYAEIRFPIMEHTNLFERSIGDVTDIVEKEMFTFPDRNEKRDSLTLRPEGTASCVRAGVQHGLLHNQVRRLWYSGPMFRHERPQKGRFRQFHQIGAEVFGLAGPDIDAELILMTARIWNELGLDGLRLEINTLGTPESRQRYRTSLLEYFGDHAADLDADSERRLQRNPLRILDSKNPEMAELIGAAPILTEHLDTESATHFDTLQNLLLGAGVSFEINPRLVRGLDYYTRTVFEWITDSLGAQGTVCAGGRYDGLVEHFGARPTPGVGFAMGQERLVSMLGEQPERAGAVDLYVLPLEDEFLGTALQSAEELRDAFPQLRVMTHCGGGNTRGRFKRADRSGATLALIIGSDELEANTITIKPLREAAEQQQIPRGELTKSLPAIAKAFGVTVEHWK